jgi:hypothetical protein
MTIDFSLTPQQQRYQRIAREFAIDILVTRNCNSYH